jgi:hypothetical protein
MKRKIDKIVRDDKKVEMSRKSLRIHVARELDARGDSSVKITHKEVLIKQ